MLLLILPHQLYEWKHLKPHKPTNIVIWEHPQYFTKYRYNKKRLLLHRASMKYYHDYLNTLSQTSKMTITYVNYNSTPKLPKTYQVFDPIDNIKLPNTPQFLPSPNFLLAKEQYETYRQTKTTKFFFNTFYNYSKSLLNILPNIKSQDKDNRNKLPKDIKLPKTPPKLRTIDINYVSQAALYISSNFPKNYGVTDAFQYPVTHKTAKAWLNNFITHRLPNFGTYQDAIAKDENYLFHSVLSSSINIGLLNPIDVINAALKAKNIPLNSKEGFIRQLFWREYQRFCYIYAKTQLKTQNYFNNNKTLTTNWYKGTTNIAPVDDCIKKAFDTGYLHHIERLMIMGNFMNLSQICPTEGFKWFMEFSCDSYEWVMYQNVYDMVFFTTGGLTMRRPYVSSSNYILKMSNYSSKEEWVPMWNKLYQDFIRRNKKKLHKFRYYFRLKN